MQAIITHYLGATNYRSSRIKASCARGAITIPYDSGADAELCHKAGAQALVNRFISEDETQYNTPADKNPWNRRRIVGQLPSGDYAHVFTS